MYAMYGKWPFTNSNFAGFQFSCENLVASQRFSPALLSVIVIELIKYILLERIVYTSGEGTSIDATPNELRLNSPMLNEMFT